MKESELNGIWEAAAKRGLIPTEPRELFEWAWMGGYFTGYGDGQDWDEADEEDGTDE